MPKYASKAKFLAPSGAQGVSLSVCLSVCLSGTSLSKALNLHLSLIVLSQICLRSVSGQSQVSLRSLCAYFVRQTKPKKLCLVFLLSLMKLFGLQQAQETGTNRIEYYHDHVYIHSCSLFCSIQLSCEP